MMFASDAHAAAYDDYERALALDPGDGEALDGLVRAAIPAGRVRQALSRVEALGANRPPTSALLVARSKLLAAIGSAADALAAARDASGLTPLQPLALEQLASLLADLGDDAHSAELEATVESLQKVAPEGAATWYYAGVSRFLRGQFEETVRLAERAIALDPRYAPVYDLVGAARTNLNQPEAAREAFETSLRFNAHDSSAYANLGLLALAARNRAAATNYFAEALWLDPHSPMAREGLAAAQSFSLFTFHF